MRTKEKAKLITFGRGGHRIHFASRQEGSISYGPSTLSGYDSPDNFVPDAASMEGCPVINLLPAVETDRGFRFVINGPMVNVDLAPGERSDCPDPSEVLAFGLSHTSYGGLLAAQAGARIGKKKYGPLDQVDVDTYCQLWREHGACVGRVVDGKIIWE